MDNFIRRIRPERTGVRAPLGDLEMAVMRHIWPCGDGGCLAAEVQEALDKDRPIALTTVLTTLNRLADKGILTREREGKAYRYRTALTEEQIQQRVVEGVLGDLMARFPKAVASYFAQQQKRAEDAATDEAHTLAELADALEVARADDETQRRREPEQDA